MFPDDYVELLGIVETAAEVYVYEVTSREIVRPSDIGVIGPVPGEPLDWSRPEPR